MEDAVVGDAGVSDTATAADVAAADVTVGLPSWLTGTWLECGGSLTVDAPAQGESVTKAIWRDIGGACEVRATVKWTDGQLDFVDLQATECTGTPPSWITAGTHATFDGTQLVIVHPALFTGLKRFSRTPDRQRWQFTSGKSVGNLDLCFDENGRFYDGRWKTEGDCWFISCGATVTQVKEVKTETHIWTECQGGCPCTSILIAKTKTESTMSGAFSTASCDTSSSGTFEATRVAFPKE